MAKPGDFDFYCEQALTGKTPIEKLYESDKVLAFYHTKPTYETHIMIIPKEHIHDLTHLKKGHDKLLLEIVSVAKKLTKKIIKENPNAGVRLITNIGEYQETPHLHFHLISGKQIR